jgi:integration host factor subunit alpha
MTVKYTKNSILQALKGGKMNFSHIEATNLLNDFFQLIESETKNGNSVKLSRFGVFHSSIRASRPAKNFKTGETIQTKSIKKLSFKKSKTS